MIFLDMYHKDFIETNAVPGFTITDIGEPQPAPPEGRGEAPNP